MSRAAYCASTRLYLLTLCLRRRVEMDPEPLDDWLRPLISNAILALTTETQPSWLQIEFNNTIPPVVRSHRNAGRRLQYPLEFPVKRS